MIRNKCVDFAKEQKRFGGARTTPYSSAPLMGFVHQAQFMRGYKAWLFDLLLHLHPVEAVVHRYARRSGTAPSWCR